MKYEEQDVAQRPGPRVGPQDIQALVAMTGMYLVDVGLTMRRVPNTPMDNGELDAIIHAIGVVTEHLTTVRGRLVALRLVMVMGSEDPENPGHEDRWDPEAPGYEDCWDPEDSEDPMVREAPVDSEGPKGPEVPEVPKYTIGASKGGMEGGPGPGSKSPVLGAGSPQSGGDHGLPAHEDEDRISRCMLVLRRTREQAIAHLKREGPIDGD